MTPTQPSHAVEAVEREKFEAWFEPAFDDKPVWNEASNCYVEFDCHMAWKGWQARAELAGPQVTPSNSEAADARREIGKWLNEEQTAPIDRVALAQLCAGFDAIARPQEVATVGVSDAEVLSALMLVGDGPYGTSDHADMRKVLENFASQRVPVALPQEPVKIEPADEVYEDPLCDCGQSQYVSHSCAYQNGHDIYVKTATPPGDAGDEVGASREPDCQFLDTCMLPRDKWISCEFCNSPATPAPKQGDAKDARLDSFHSDSGDRDRVQRVELSGDELALFQRTLDDFADCGETETDYEVLVNWARRGLLECTNFRPTAAAHRMLASSTSTDQKGNAA